jgi:hypothetical protein
LYGIHNIASEIWVNKTFFNDWWTKLALQRRKERNARYDLLLEIWKERNARVFRQTSSTTNMVITTIKDEAKVWCLARAKN